MNTAIYIKLLFNEDLLLMFCIQLKSISYNVMLSVNCNPKCVMRVWGKI